MGRSRYLLDHDRLIYRKVRLNGRQKVSRFFLILGVSLALTAAYIPLFNHFFGSPKVNMLTGEIEELKYKYGLLEQDFNNTRIVLKRIADTEDNVYRPVLDMDALSQSFRHPGYGGSNKYEELEGFANSDIIIQAAKNIDEIERMAYVQSKSFEDIVPEAADWKNKLEHIPYIQPVRVNIPLGDGIKFRDVHPVLGISRWHYGQDFTAPLGTKVYATGAGKVIHAEWNPYGFGNRVEIDHGYGFVTIYGHLSQFNVEVGQEVKRGDLLGFTGSTGVSSGPHLHYEIHYNGTVQNPLYFFDDDLTLEEYNKMISALESDTL